MTPEQRATADTWRTWNGNSIGLLAPERPALPPGGVLLSQADYDETTDALDHAALLVRGLRHLSIEHKRRMRIISNELLRRAGA